jgi:hypothetical protein
VKKNGEALYHVPESLKTPELCLEAIKNDIYGNALEYVPDSIKTPELCIEAVKNDYDAFECVPEHLKPQVKAALEAHKLHPI